MPSAPNVIRLNVNDNVAVAVDAISAGTPIGDRTALSDIPAGHKIALNDIACDDPVVKYGQVIGFASQSIAAGHHVHTHNMVMGDVQKDYAIGTGTSASASLDDLKQASFNGIKRENGRVGTRNYIGVLATVSCSSSVAHLIAKAIPEEELSRYKHVDGLVALGHGSGCCLPPDGQGFQILQRTIAGYAQHPNFAGVLLVGLGCEVNQIDGLMANTGLAAGNHIRTLNIQTEGGTRATVAQGAKILREMLVEADRTERQNLSAEHLVLGLECGGSDAYSGITANPSLGAAVDRLVASGGTAILSETPEIYGAEHLLTRRAINRSVGEKLIDRIRWWEAYTANHGAVINNNPTPGNKAGGLTTILEKSLGASAKGGTTNLVDVLGYAETVLAPGLNFMDTPGYDVVSITGMIAGGANMVCFTTGRGTVCGFRPVPTLKLASNSTLYQQMPDDLDIDCGQVLTTPMTTREMGDIIFEHLLETASGKPTKSEQLGFGDHEFVPWSIGAVL